MVMLVNYVVCSVAWVIYGILTGAAFVFRATREGGDDV
jgi:hypothetical protein